MKKWIFSIPVIIALALSPGIARAHSTPTVPAGWTGTYKVVSSGEEYVLIMLNGVYTPPDEGVSPETDAVNRLLLKYPSSGLYKNNGSTTPLWVMDYMSFGTNITLSSDGHHLVVWGSSTWDTQTYGDTALAFYNDGHLLTRYSVADLVEVPEELPQSIGDYEWLYDASLDDARGQLTVKTHNRETYVFSLSTGRAINRSVATAVPAKRVNRRKLPTYVPTTLPEIIDPYNTPSTLSTNEQDHTMVMGLLLSGGSLGTLFAGVSILSRKARRKRRSHVSSSA